MKKAAKVCELCNGEAAVFCGADAAFLCWACDARVHGANFLVARHSRTLACARCRSFSAGDLAGAGLGPMHFLCGACDAASCCFSTADSASSAVAVAEKSPRLKKRRRARAVFVGDLRLARAVQFAMEGCGESS